MELQEDVVRRDVTLDAGRAAVWRALTDRDRLAGWLAAAVDVEIREGATGTTTDDDGTVRDVTVEEVRPGRRLALRWCADGEEPTLVELTVDDAPDGRTRLVVVEMPVRLVRAVADEAVGGASRGPMLLAA